MISKSILSSKTFLTYTLGCRTNQAEMEKISQQLIETGFFPFQNLCHSESMQLCISPDIVLLNTCVVTQKAEKETKQTIRQLKKKYPNSCLIVLGCGVDAKEKLGITLPEVDLFISNKEKENTSKIILIFFNMLRTKERDPSISVGMTENNRHSERSRCNIGGVEESLSTVTDKTQNKYISSGRKFIKIQEGCNNFCSFCITCFLRGKPKSVLPEKIIEEINFWVEKEVKEVILTGINIGLYGVIASEARYRTVPGKARQSRPDYVNPTGLLRCSTPRNDIILLLNKILSETTIERLTFSSIYPEMVTDEFLKVVVNNPRISQYFHLSLQSGSQTVLERMGRKTNLNELLKKLQWIKEKNPNFTFRADIITGFPDEAEKEFQETLNFIQETRISFAHIFTYSPRKGTVAYENINEAKRSPSEVWPGRTKGEKWQDLPESIKKERSEKIRKVVEKIREEEARKIIAKLLNCLIVKETQCHSRVEPKRNPAFGGESGNLYRFQVKPGMTMYEGITENGWPIKLRIMNQESPLRRVRRNFTGQARIKNIKGKIVSVKVTGFERDYLIGEILGKKIGQNQI